MIKLFEIRIVASNLLGFCSKSITSLALGWFSFSRSGFDSEKKAISVPEMRPEKTNKTKSENIPEAAGQPISKTNKILAGSGSKEYYLSL